jgi:hypothetical protein
MTAGAFIDSSSVHRYQEPWRDYGLQSSPPSHSVRSSFNAVIRRGPTARNPRAAKRLAIAAALRALAERRRGDAADRPVIPDRPGAVERREVQERQDAVVHPGAEATPRLELEATVMVARRVPESQAEVSAAAPWEAKVVSAARVAVDLVA